MFAIAIGNGLWHVACGMRHAIHEVVRDMLHEEGEEEKEA